MLDERRLDLGGRDPDATHLQHVVAATAVPVVAILVAIVLVASLDPRAAQRVLGLLVLVPIEGHRRIALDAQVPDRARGHRRSFLVDDRNLVTGDGNSGGART